jgi:hydroxymethylpyrimidine pyrophosphatase-like HAD family hydrolase
VPYLVEVSYKDAGKGSALKRLCSWLNIPLENCVAFGNADNDIDMLKECGLGVAVENATERCLACADMVAPHHNEDGVAFMIETFLKNI